MPIPKILITGANGQLGNEFRALEDDFPGYEFIFLSREELSINDAASVQKVFTEHAPQWCINCAAYTAVDKAETEREQAMAINGEAAGILAAASKALNARFVHISTDYVFDGSSSVPYRENDATGPINTYGHSKLLGEQLVQRHNPDAIIIRTAWVYSVFGNNFVKTMMRLMKERESINVVSDQHGSPTYAADLAKAIMHIIRSSSNTSGIFHYSNEGETNWFEFASAIKELIGSTCQVNPIPSSQYPTPAKRPQYSLLDKTKIRSTFNLEIPYWKDSLDLCLSRLTSPK
ncbi:MAG TPA: dTDP-4-dehydrorhamnose reductase [Chitinophagaceae bacterium]|nr:dTDP-4-dehydrorhamnose reductase [Chitinophagaceae bacterium]